MFKSGVPMKSFSALGVGCGFVSAKLQTGILPTLRMSVLAKPSGFV